MKAPNTKTDVEAIVAARATESQVLEFKSALPDKSDRDCFEFAADVSALANTAGGTIVFGIVEIEGAAVEAPGLPGLNPDAEIRRLEEILANGLQPRIPGIQFRTISGFERGSVLVVVVPRSWNGPHMVARSGHQRFFHRGSASKVPMSIDQIRQAFAASEDIPQQVRTWRDARVRTIHSGLGPTRLRTSNGSLFLHVLPFAAFAQRSRFDVVGARDKLSIQPLAHRGWGQQITLDGVMWHATRDNPRECLAYTLLFRNGVIEAWLGDLTKSHDGVKRIPSVAMEEYPLRVLGKYFEALKTLEVPLPWAVGLSFAGVEGARLAVPERFDRPYDIDWFDRDTVMTELLVLESVPIDLGAALRPAFDEIWNAAGWPASVNYDQSGKWVGHR